MEESEKEYRDALNQVLVAVAHLANVIKDTESDEPEYLEHCCGKIKGTFRVCREGGEWLFCIPAPPHMPYMPRLHIPIVAYPFCGRALADSQWRVMPTQKLSELIAFAKRLKAEHGDLEIETIMLCDDDYGDRVAALWDLKIVRSEIGGQAQLVVTTSPQARMLW